MGWTAFLRAHRVVIRGGSMAPALLPGDRLLVDPAAYRAREPRRGDIVLLRDPHERRRLLVKRVIALPGETVWEDDEGLVSVGAPGVLPVRRTWTLGVGEYFVVGDREGVSRDSRVFGPVGREALLGRAWLIYWPPHRWRRL
jgi:signal peptidase I